MTTLPSHRHPLPQTHHYIRFSISPPLANPDALHIRHTLQDALAQSFGVALSHLYLDVLSVSPSGAECVIRANSPSDAAKVMAAVTVANVSPRLSTLKESPFLPSVSDNSQQII
ncbi:hypothetical protein BC827DRAFT_1137369 [Russula dissimulans]|nr:hypothetical protein BC827DRAFT_1137369 [Russula dissimulans]